jgi:hypothetical protein
MQSDGPYNYLASRLKMGIANPMKEKSFKKFVKALEDPVRRSSRSLVDSETQISLITDGDARNYNCTSAVERIKELISIQPLR